LRSESRLRRWQRHIPTRFEVPPEQRILTALQAVWIGIARSVFLIVRESPAHAAACSDAVLMCCRCAAFVYDQSRGTAAQNETQCHPLNAACSVKLCQTDGSETTVSAASREHDAVDPACVRPDPPCETALCPEADLCRPAFTTQSTARNTAHPLPQEKFMLPRLYLAAIGLLYLALAFWCTFDPETTSQKVGFTLNGDSGRSEFMTVYGGLEFGMAVIFLMPFVRPDLLTGSLLACVAIHAALVVFRGISLVMYSDFAAFTGRLAIGEWVIFLIGLAVCFFELRGAGTQP
jgi:hypothetical protein